MTQDTTVTSNADYNGGEDGLGAVIHGCTSAAWAALPGLVEAFFREYEESVVLLPIGQDNGGYVSEVHLYLLNTNTKGGQDSKNVKYAEDTLQALYVFTKGFVAAL